MDFIFGLDALKHRAVQAPLTDTNTHMEGREVIDNPDPPCATECELFTFNESAIFGLNRRENQKSYLLRLCCAYGLGHAL